MSIAEIILSGILLLVSVLTCVVTLSMDKADNNLSVINGLSSTMMKNNKNDVKYTKNKIVIGCMFVLFGIIVVIVILTKKGIF